ncbi:hypothetical protein [uncultured Brachyspira sp.]|uniref:hypothetical protein n=1 Tax=uncultured Brachyspira sp. TaxID=221953 RepID=UPI002608429B|nr:hypothetical protein [uncultured Brachyspira sp.]
MLKKLFLFWLFLLSLFALSCNNNALKPDVYSKESIDKKYPYWQVGIENFEIDSRLNKRTVITVDEKKYILVCMALMILAVNTDEFAERVKASEGSLKSSVGDSYDGHTLQYGEQYNAQKLIDSVRSLKYNFTYRKMNVAAGTGTGEQGKSRYLRYGLQNENDIPTGKLIGLSSGNWGSLDDVLFGDYFTYMQSQTYANVAGLMFHEHMHNIGFNHFGDYNVPAALQGVVTQIINEMLWKPIEGPALKKKYSKQLDELIAYYLTEYKHLLNEDTVFDPSSK